MTSFPNFDEPDNDPRIWLEEIEGHAALSWVEAQNARTVANYADAQYVSDRDALAAIYNREDNIPQIMRRGMFCYNFWRDANNPRGKWRRTTLASYKKYSPDWEVLLDLDALAMSEDEDWVWRSASFSSSADGSVILRLSRGGTDAVVLREFDLNKRQFVHDGFNLPAAKQFFSWWDENSILVASTLADAHSTKSGYARSIRLWRRGEPLNSSTALFDIPVDHIYTYTNIDRSTGIPRILFIDQQSFFDAVTYIGDITGVKQRINLPPDAWWRLQGDFIAIKPRTPWIVDGIRYLPDTLLGGRLSDIVDGRAHLEILFEPAERLVLKSFFWAGKTLIVSILDNLRPVFMAFNTERGYWQKTELVSLLDEGLVDIWVIDERPEDSNGDLLISVQGPLTPPTLMLSENGKSPEILKRAPSVFLTNDLITSRHEAMSADGERIPYVQVGPQFASGEAPVLMYGYGGFGNTQLPVYNSAIGKLWLERGGTYVLAHIRGGGEFGTRWHNAGIREGKTRSHDDFAAVAADLVRRGITVPQRIAAEGASNGGLLMMNMLTRYPRLFGALFCTIPLIDMRRYSKLLAGASWIAEYGDPTRDEDWEYLKHISAYHVESVAKCSPPVLIATSRKDDRVHPGHARKMAKKLQELGHNAWFYETVGGGHGYGKDNREKASFVALGYSFLRHAINWK